MKTNELQYRLCLHSIPTNLLLDCSALEILNKLCSYPKGNVRPVLINFIKLFQIKGWQRYWSGL